MLPEGLKNASASSREVWQTNALREFKYLVGTGEITEVTEITETCDK